MTVEGFVRMSGALMGFARESFGAGERSAGAAALTVVPGGLVSGSGSAVAAFDAESDLLGGHLAALGDPMRWDPISSTVRSRRRRSGVTGWMR